ncbi:MAG TPA: M3 family metallopeptidase [Polyangiaceae bacterium LLY-WYZ-15_(1-7)]|nr:oligopeptidase A [Myxococcales bacterium]MAT26033.1 oligopeptidase A [Sandaracinus sp.]HJK91528.1 M3 family metallopeptidase [Polyangiaceae bacterium LLY-WYZ-15_(1-7)]MBJ73810.1 oligopeptidase A [Sandaracinus sp.]HJL04969.1 M3 family metallopeptidase [Polyangiaceae bacterium LLY-WYZ-15_(1-7)]
MASENPLLDIPFDIPFDHIRAEHVVPAVDALIDDAQARLDAIVAVDGPRTFANTLGALEEATEKLGVMTTVVGHLESVATTPELREAYNEAIPKVSAFWSRIPLNSDLYAALKAYAETEDGKALEGPQARLLEKTLDEFRRHGANLADEEKEALHALDVELTRKTTRFAQNLLDETNAWDLVVTEESKLAGLPPSAKAAAKQAAEDKEVEGWRFTLQAPSYIAVMTYLDDAAIREQMWRAYNTRASSGERDNRGLIVEILKLRRQKAKRLGYADFADFVLEDRMAKSGEKAMAFVDDLRAKTQAAFDREKDELLAFRRELEGDDAPALQPWDVAYYAEKLRQSRYAFDEEELRPYFEVERVLEGLFALAGELYGIEVKRRDAPAWDEDVRCYGVHDGGEMIAAFYVDLHPRENKRGGAWMNALISGASLDEMGPHLGLFCANVTRPTKEGPALLRHSEVETLFHEFGHLLHHALSEVPIQSLAGTNVAWDFVELPSQIMENFCWERASLDHFARHHETGEPIPEALFAKMQKVRTYRAATAQMRQLGFATVDLRMHRELDPEALTPESMLAFARDVLDAHASAPVPDDYAMICGFNHLFASPTGYAAGYYSYKWAEVLDADAFTRFAEAGVVSREVGGAFREHILAKGDSEEPGTLYERFMGRPPKLEALLKRSGLQAA